MVEAGAQRMLIATIPCMVPTNTVFPESAGVAKRDATPTPTVARTSPVAALRA